MIMVDNKEIRICIINVWFGNLPNYFPLWLKSASFNPNIDFLIFGDQSYNEALPDNVAFYKTDLEFIRKRAADILGMETVLETPYKLCDYKVLYGKIFEGYLNGYDYWGHCDLDLIWGNLEKCFIENKITNYEKFFPLGHLSLYKNEGDINMRICSGGGGVKDYKEIYSTNDICRADEMWGIIPIYLNNGYSFFKKKCFADITCIHKRYTLAGSSYEEGEIIKNYKHQVFLWENGTIYRVYIDNDKIQYEEYAYIHFQRRKNYCVSFDPDDVSCFLITSKGFVPFSDQLTRRDIKHYGEYKGAFREWWDIHKHDLKYWVIEHYEAYFHKMH